MKNSSEENRKWSQIVAKAWIDPQFKTKLLSHPEQVLREHGLAHGNLKYRIIEAHKNEICLVLPAKPEGNMSEAELRNIAAAGGEGACGLLSDS